MECCYEEHRKRYLADPQKVKDRARKWRQENPERHRANQNKWNAENRERVNARQAIVRERNRERIRRQRRECYYRRKDKEMELVETMDELYDKILNRKLELKGKK